MGMIALLVIPREEEPQISVPMVDIRVSADGLKAPDAVELVTKPLEAIVKGIDGVEHVYSQTEDDRVMVTARFLVGTKAEDAILRVHEKIRANLRPHPRRHSRAVDRRTRHQRRRRRRRSRCRRKPGSGVTLDEQGPLRARRQAARRADEGRQCRPDLYFGRTSASRSGSSPTPRSSRSTASRCSSWSPRCATPIARSRPARCAMPGRRARSRPGRRSRECPTSGSCWSRRATIAAGLRARRRQRRDRPEPARASRLERSRRNATATWNARTGRQPGHRQARRRQRRGRGGGLARADRDAAGAPGPGGRGDHGDARLRRDRQREGQRAPVPSRARHPLDRRPHRDSRSAGARPWSPSSSSRPRSCSRCSPPT